MTQQEVEQDYKNTERDANCLTAIVENLETFIRQAGSEDRSAFRMDLLKYQGLRDTAERLLHKIEIVRSTFSS